MYPDTSQVLFQRFPTVEEIAGALCIDDRTATWLWSVCQVADRIAGLIYLNELAACLMDGIQIMQIDAQIAMFVTLHRPPLYQRGER
jgi:hypothetical protein